MMQQQINSLTNEIQGEGNEKQNNYTVIEKTQTISLVQRFWQQHL